MSRSPLMWAKSLSLTEMMMDAARLIYLTSDARSVIIFHRPKRYVIIMLIEKHTSQNFKYNRY